MRSPCSLDNLTYQKWEQLICSLDDFGVRLNLPNKMESNLTSILTTDFSHFGYRRMRAKLILKDTVEKYTAVLPLFVLLLAFFCSSPTACK